jgi:hypothetical protein
VVTFDLDFGEIVAQATRATGRRATCHQHPLKSRGTAVVAARTESW